MKLSVIIVNYNVRYFLELCLQSVQEALTEIDSEIIVVDNNSTDDSCKMVIEKFPNKFLSHQLISHLKRQNYDENLQNLKF